jgi:hypothetical protein
VPGNTVSITGSPRDILSASSGSSGRARRCRSRTVSSDSSPTILPPLTSCTSSGRSLELPIGRNANSDDLRFGRIAGRSPQTHFGLLSETLVIVGHAALLQVIALRLLHSLVDDHSQLAYSEILPDEKGATCARFLLRAAAYLARHGIERIDRSITDTP